MKIIAIETEDGRRFERLYRPDDLVILFRWLREEGPTLYILPSDNRSFTSETVEGIKEHFTNRKNELFVRTEISDWFAVSFEDLFYEVRKVEQ